MGTFLDLKSSFLAPLIRWITLHPKTMEGKVFRLAMAIFPSKISQQYDNKY